MRQSKLFTKTFKKAPKDENSFNASALIRAGFIDKLGAGIYSFLPLGLRTLNRICRIVREEMDALGGQEILMPALNPKDNWQKTNRWASFDVLFKLNGSDDREYVLAPTHEEVVTPLVGKHIFSYKELPLAVYHIQTKFRNELRAKAGLMRTREFSMKDMYSFHRDDKDLDAFYDKVKESYFRIFKRCGLGEITYLTFASGGLFSKYSHEFQTLSESGEDNIYLCSKCKVAINKEIIKEQDACPVCQNKKLEVKKAVEVGNIFKLGTRFSKDFNFAYTESDGKERLVKMGCYGIGPSRVMGTIVEVSHDDKGIVWPEEVAPFGVHLILLDNSDKSIRESAEKIYQLLLDNKIEVLYDDRDEKSAGEKFADSDLIGIPTRLVVSKKTLEKNSVELKKRNSQETTLVKMDKIISVL